MTKFLKIVLKMMLYITAAIFSFLGGAQLAQDGLIMYYKQNSERLFTVDRLELEEYYIRHAIKHGIPAQETHRRIRLIQIFLTDNITPPKVGLCFPDRGPYGTIFFDRKAWENYSQEDKELLYIHEVGHCAFSLPHTTTENDVMSEYLMDSVSWGTLKKDAMKRYFNSVQNAINGEVLQ